MQGPIQLTVQNNAQKDPRRVIKEANEGWVKCPKSQSLLIIG